MSKTPEKKRFRVEILKKYHGPTHATKAETEAVQKRIAETRKQKESQ